jgi:hypothetical protein
MPLTLYQKRRLVQYHILSRFSRLTTPEGYDFAFIPEGMSPPTAAWRYDEARHRHNLVINEGVDVHADRIVGPGKHPFPYMVSSFSERVYDHEGAHSLFTDRDNKKLKALAAKFKVPHPLWNLFEDARIEAEWRRKLGRRFHWFRYSMWSYEKPKPPLVGPPPSAEDAIGLFLDCIHAENSPKLLSKWVADDKNPKMQYESKGPAKYNRRHLVRWYYRRAIKTKDTAGLLPLIASWIKTFPETNTPPSLGECIAAMIGGMDMPGEGEGGGMPVCAVDAEGDKHKEIEKTLKPMKPGSGPGAGGGDGTVPGEEKDEDYHYEGPSTKYPVPENKYFSKNPRRHMNWTRANQLIRLFEKFLEGGEGMISSRNPTNRIDMNRFMRGADDYFIRKGDDPYGVKEISFIMDCSGSMGRAVEEGVYLAYVLNELVYRRKIKCKQMLCSGGDHFALPMPFNPKLLDHLLTPGGTEGFARTMRAHEKELVATDLTIFFTDGNITDEHIVKADWHRKGVYTIGLFVGEPERSKSLHRWFDSVLVRNDIESVADSLIQLIKR